MAYAETKRLVTGEARSSLLATLAPLLWSLRIVVVEGAMLDFATWQLKRALELGLSKEVLPCIVVVVVVVVVVVAGPVISFADDMLRQ